MMSVYQAREIVLFVSPSLGFTEEGFRRQFGIMPLIPVHLRMIEHGAFSKELVRTEYLQRVFRIVSLLPPRTYLGLRTEEEETALLQLLNFTEDHYPTMVRSFHRNHPWDPTTRLICGNHALYQLNMTSHQPSESVIGIFDKAITPMGRRKMKERLLSPFSRAEEIQARLSEVSEYQSWSDIKIQSMERQLRFMYDLPRLHRRLLCGLVTFSEIAHLIQTYRAMEHVMDHLTIQTILAPTFTKEDWLVYHEKYHVHFDESKTLSISEDNTPFSAMTYPDIAIKEQEITVAKQEVYDLRKIYSTTGKIPEDSIRVEEREKEPYGLRATPTAIQQLKKHTALLPAGTKYNELRSGGWVDCTALQRLNGKIIHLRDELKQLVHRHMLDACSAIADAGKEIWQPMEEWISRMDVTQCIARVSRERSFVCPTIVPSDEKEETESFLEVEQMRHPLVEQIASRITYVKHDISLGPQSDRGWLLYALNGVGKTVLMKATGLCVLLAQAGCFVPAKSMRFRPFTAIYTRILNNDNLFQGLSTFTVEMSELRDILQRANPTTLVLGDEISSGTESISGQAIVTSSIKWLARRKAKFIFATHLHDVPRWLNLKEDRIAVWHLHVEYDPVSKKLIYDRSLRAGSGSSLYGLEVAKALDLPHEFIEEALAIRHSIIGSNTQLHAKVSTWNTQIVRKECEICHSPMVSGLEVHHLQERSTATKHGRLVDGSHMNDVRNLLVICQVCHDKLHAGKIRVGALQMTTAGPEREIEIIDDGNREKEKEKEKNPSDPVSKRHSKWNEEDVLKVRETLMKYPSSSLKSLRAYLSSTYAIDMSESVLGRIRKEL